MRLTMHNKPKAMPTTVLFFNPSVLELSAARVVKNSSRVARISAAWALCVFGRVAQMKRATRRDWKPWACGLNILFPISWE
jgi:hypothetical protein